MKKSRISQCSIEVLPFLGKLCPNIEEVSLDGDMFSYHHIMASFPNAKCLELRTDAVTNIVPTPH